MARILILEADPPTLRRMFNVLYDARQHDLLFAENLSASVKLVEQLETCLDLLVIDVSMFETMAIRLLDLFARACPRAKMLVITPSVKTSLGQYPQLRKPFMDRDLLQAVNQVLAMRHDVVVELDDKSKPAYRRQSDGRLIRARASGR